MRILIISTMAGNPWGGSEVLWYKIAKSLLGKNHEVFISIYDWGKSLKQHKELESKGAKIIKRSRINYSDLLGKIKGKLMSFSVGKYQLKKLLKLSPDVVFFSHGAAFDLSILIYRNFLENLKCPYYCYLSLNTEYEVLNYERMDYQRKAFKNASKIFFASFRNYTTAKRQLCSNLENSVVINNPITFDDFSPIEYPQTENEQIRFAMVARLNAYVKGHPIILESLSQEFWKDKDWTLSIYGKGPDEKYIKELISFYNLENKVFLKGYANNIKQDIWTTNQVLLMGSQYEGCPISLYDAAFCGRAAVVTDVGGNAEFVKEGVNGFVAEAPSTKSFQNALRRCWNSRDKLNIMGEAAKAKAHETLDFNPEETVIKHLLFN